MSKNWWSKEKKTNGEFCGKIVGVELGGERLIFCRNASGHKRTNKQSEEKTTNKTTESKRVRESEKVK